GVVVRIRGQHDDLGIRPFRADLAARLDAGAVREPHIHDDDVGLEPAGGFDGLSHGARLGNDLEPRPTVEQRYQALADHLVVIDHEQPQLACGRTAWFVTDCHGSTPSRGSSALPSSASGTITMIVVPVSLLSRSNDPPSASARSRMFARPWWPTGAPTDGSKPDPSSDSSRRSA